MEGIKEVLISNFTVLRERDLRIYFGGNTINLLGDWMQQTAQAWVVWQLTHSAAALGAVAFFSQLPYFIFGPWVGVVADRFDRRTILLVTQVFTMFFAFALAILLDFHVLVLWHVDVLAFLLGVVSAFNTTAEQAFIGDLAGEGGIQKAVAVNNSLTQLTRLVGPALAGYLIAQTGVAASFWINGLGTFVSILCIRAVHSRRPPAATMEGGVRQFREGWRFFIGHPLLKLVILFAGTQAFFGLSIIQLLPAIASAVLKGNADTLGRLLGAAGAGALIGILLVLPFIEQIKRRCMAIGGALLWSGIWYSTLSLTHTVWVDMLGLCLASMGAANAVTLSIGLAQELTPPGLRARVVSVFMMIIYGLQPVAAYLVGLGADRIGLQRMVLVNGVIMVVIPGILLSMPKLRHLKRGEEIVARKARCVGY